MELMSFNVGMKQVEPVIKSVLHNLTNLEVAELPKLLNGNRLTSCKLAIEIPISSQCSPKIWSLAAAISISTYIRMYTKNISLHTCKLTS